MLNIISSEIFLKTRKVNSSLKSLHSLDYKSRLASVLDIITLYFSY